MVVDFLVLTAGNGISEYRNSLGLRTLGAHKVAWIAREHGYSTMVVGKLQLLSEEEIVEMCSKFVGPGTVIGVSTTMIAIPGMGARQTSAGNKITTNIFNAIHRLKAEHNNKVIAGGPLASLFQNSLKQDYTIDGQAENKVVELLDKIKRFGIQKKPYDWNIKTCGFRWADHDFLQPDEVVPLETGRGCIFSCNFCAWEEIGKKKGTYETSLDSIQEQLVENYEKFGVTHYMLMTDTFNDNDERMNEWCDMLESLPFKIKYSGFMRLDLMHRYQNTTRRMYETGLRGCHFGIESFHPEASRAIGKAFNGKKGKEFLDKLHNEIFERNVFITTTNIIGLPGEDEKSVEETFEWYKNRNYIQAVFSSLFLSTKKEYYVKNSEFSANPEKNGYRFPDPNDTEYWVNDNFDFYHASELAKKYNEDLIKPTNIDSWTGLNLLAALNEEPRTYFSQTNSELRIRAKHRVFEQNKKYFESIRNMS